jgi:hypothetical protein
MVVRLHLYGSIEKLERLFLVLFMNLLNAPHQDHDIVVFWAALENLL